MKIEINKQDFDDAILVATSSNPEVFNLVRPHFSTTYNRIKRFCLGDIGAEFFDENEDFQPLLKRWVCLETFITVVRHLDLVLTPTGFGVVSNGEVSPASTVRVENLIEQVKQAKLAAEEEVVFVLVENTEGWGLTMQAKLCIPCLVWGYNDYMQEASLTKLNSADWDTARQNMRLADEIMRRRFSNEQMDALLDKYRRGVSWTEPEQKAVCLIRKYLVDYSNPSCFKPNDMKQTLDRIQMVLDGDAETFALYQSSSEYESNHFKPYENKKSAPAFLFNA